MKNKGVNGLDITTISNEIPCERLEGWIMDDLGEELIFMNGLNCIKGYMGEMFGNEEISESIRERLIERTIFIVMAYTPFNNDIDEVASRIAGEVKSMRKEITENDKAFKRANFKVVK